MQLHIFSDASEKTYGCCPYLWLQEDEKLKVSLVISKVRVSPFKRVTLPRLELVAALLGARILNFLLNSLQLPFTVQVKCYSDSMITFTWIKGQSRRWNTFVANRVKRFKISLTLLIGIIVHELIILLIF